MISQTTRRFFVIALVSAIVSATGSAACADDAANRTFAFCDKNRDGKLDAGELDGIPVSLRDWLVKHGPNSKSGIAKADFLRVYPRMIADLRKQTVGAATNGSSTQAADTASDVRTPKTDGNDKTTASPPLYASTPPSDELVETVRPSNLPSGYQEADLDKDDQVDYFEWRKAKLGGFAKFQELDLNNDSVLSPQELGAAGTVVAASSSSSSSPAAASSTPAPSTTASPTTSAVPSAPSGPSEEYLTQVKYYFEVMDKQMGNKNGVLDPTEWNASKRIKPAFEQAKVDISKPMDEKTFVAHYLKIFPEKKKEEPRKIGPGSKLRFPGASGGKTRRRRR